VFGVEYLSMLGGVVFMAHQVGSFFGVWLGGLLFDRTGSYGLVWWMSVVLGVVAAFLCLPIREERVPRLAVAGAAA
jgi:predicted MFS family arabinose efflux permease